MLNRIKLFVIVVSASILIGACASYKNPTYGPVKEENFQKLFLESIADDQQKVIFYSRAIWYANKNGFKFIPAGKKSLKGIIVYTDQGIYFSEWGTKKYSVVFSANYNQLEEHRLVTNDLFGRIVVRRGNFHSFEILGINGPDLPNKNETEVAYQIIVQQQKK